VTPPGAAPEATADALISKRAFIAELADALRRRTGYAAGKLSYSHVHRLAYRVMSERLTHPELFLRDAERMLRFESHDQLGIFPAAMEFYPRFDAFWVEHLRQLDCIGLFPTLMKPNLRILRHYAVAGRRIDYHDQEPDRSSPSREQDCYLPLFAGRRLLLVCPFADLLRERATRATFEAVWAKTGKRWFEPASVDSLEIPYGFARSTQVRYPTVIDLYERITADLDAKRFDIALVAAAGLAVPIASHLKRRGHLAIDLGGHLQVLFGVLGKRWRDRVDWRERYITDAWIDMPARYRPEETGVCDDGAYW